MKVEYTWALTAILALPFAWFTALLLYIRAFLLSSLSFLLVCSIGIIIGLLLTGILADRIKWNTHLLIISEILLLLLGIGLAVYTFDIWLSPLGIGFLFFLNFLFGSGLVLLTLFLNKLISSRRRGHVVGIVTVVILVVGGLLSVVWRVFHTPIAPFIPPSIAAALILFGMIIGYLLIPRKIELQTYMVPGQFLPYVIWWIIYLAAYGLFIWATPQNLRILFNSVLRDRPILWEPPIPFAGELTVLGIGGATFVFTFLPDKLGRKRVFSIASVLLGVVCIFGGAQLESGIGWHVAFVLMVLQAFVIAFIIGVGAWLVWAEIGAIRFKGQRIIFGWALVALLGLVICVVSFLTFSPSSDIAALLFPVSALLVLVGVFPLTNAIESLGNERIVEEIDVRVDSRQVTRAIRDLEVDTSLKSIEAQIESEIALLTNIQGLTRRQAKELRDAGYETPTLVARAKIKDIAQILTIPPEKAAIIIANAKKVRDKEPKSGVTMRSKQRTQGRSS